MYDLLPGGGGVAIGSALALTGGSFSTISGLTVVAFSLALGVMILLRERRRRLETAVVGTISLSTGGQA